MLSTYFVGEFLMRKLTLNIGPGKEEYHWYFMEKSYEGKKIHHYLMIISNGKLQC